MPASLQSFDARLRSAPGYQPTETFYAKVEAKYGQLDLEEEAEKMVGWLRAKQGRACTAAFVLNWLGKAAADARQRQAAPGKPRNGPVSRQAFTVEDVQTWGQYGVEVSR